MIAVGDSLIAVWADEGQTGGKVGSRGVLSITVDQLPGPMGYYFVAVLKCDNNEPWESAPPTESIIPLHMASEVVRADAEKGGEDA